MANPEPIEVLARRWLDLDRDETTRKEIEALLRDNNKNELEQRLRNRIAFGTAGLRASMKAGFVHMNSLTVLQASHGLAQYITEPNTVSLHESKGPRRFKVVIGHDARHNSERFARLTAAAFLDRKFQVLWLGKAHGTAGNDKKHENDMVSKPEGQRASPLSNAKLNQDHGTLSSPSIRNGFVHTPLVPFAVKHYGADAGVMITASHNPKNDNGYKVYWNNGCQIIPPHDRGIAAAIETIGEVDTWNATNVDRDPKTTNIFDLVNEAYFHSIHHLSPEPSYSEVTPRFMYTPMHGVGLPFMRQAVETLHCAQAMQIVEAQADPDPEFPTVPFPNPEETGALDLAKREAEANDCSLILANDPDADRFAAVERLDDGEWHQFTGNEMGILLASYLLETYEGERSKLVMLASAVSSRMLAVMAKKEGFYFRETLTGFKWLGNVAQELKRNGYDPIFAYEEAIGYMFPSVVWDKDGIAAAAVFLRAISVWRGQGLTPYRKLQQLYKKYGYFQDANTYLISPSPDTTNRVFNDIRKLKNGSRPDKLGSRPVLQWRDLTLGYDSDAPDTKPLLPTDPSAQMITCRLSDVIFTARGSGTEPKIKLYIEGLAENAADARRNANEVLKDLLQEWFTPNYSLKLPGT